jgi:hypothetical protein
MCVRSLVQGYTTQPPARVVNVDFHAVVTNNPVVANLDHRVPYTFLDNQQRNVVPGAILIVLMGVCHRGWRHMQALYSNNRVVGTAMSDDSNTRLHLQHLKSGGDPSFYLTYLNIGHSASTFLLPSCVSVSAKVGVH